MIQNGIQKNICSYCGEAPINHRLHYFESAIISPFDSHMTKTAKRAPAFLKRFVDVIPVGLFKGLALLGLAHFSSDIEKANSFRSRIIWEEARKRGIVMEQVIIGKRPIEWYRAIVNGTTIYFESIPIQSQYLDLKEDWDNKILLKKELAKHDIPVPQYAGFTFFRHKNLLPIFSKLTAPIIVKPQVGSRGRHTVTNINTLEQFKEGVAITSAISPYIVAEEHLEGHICRATVVGGVLAGFYRATSPFIVGDGVKTIRELIEEKDSTRPLREHVVLSDELLAHVLRSGFTLDDIVPEGQTLSLTHRCGRLFGGMTKEMIDELHPSFVPIIEKAAKVIELSVVGFDCIIPDPTKDAASQRWGIIECNTLPFIDMHYYALEGKPRNIAGMVWDLWDKPSAQL